MKLFISIIFIASLVALGLMISQGPPVVKTEADTVAEADSGFGQSVGGLPQSATTDVPAAQTKEQTQPAGQAESSQDESSQAETSRGRLITFTSDGSTSKVNSIDVATKKSTLLFSDEKSDRKIIMTARLSSGADSLVAVLAKDGDVSGQLVAIPLDGSGKITVLQEKFATSEAPTISPDQTKIARTVFSTGEQDFGFAAIVEPIVGGDQSIVARDSAGLRSLSFSPDGKRLAFVPGTTAGARAIHAVQLSDGKSTKLYESADLVIQDFRWTSATLLAVALGSPGEAAKKILIVDMAANANVEVAADTAAKHSPLIAPDGTGIAYVKSTDNRSQSGEVIVAASNGGQPSSIGAAMEIIGWIK